MNRVGKIITISALTLVLFIIGFKLGKTEQRMSRVLVNYESRMNALEDSIEGMKKVFNAAMGSVDAHFYLENARLLIIAKYPNDAQLRAEVCEGLEKELKKFEEDKRNGKYKAGNQDRAGYRATTR